MPLLGKKIFVCSKPPTDIKSDEPVFTIPHTKEQFTSKKDYEKRLAWYKESIWTCQCTGHINLTHEEAWKSEKAIKKILKSQFPSCCEKPVLELVHHSTIPLDALVDQAWLKLQQVLCIGEKVSLKVKSAGKVIEGVVTKVDTAGVQANPTSNCSSPSSDKENCSSEGNSPKKWTPPKLLPYKYSVQLEDADKIINAVPAEDLLRSEKAPSKDLVRYFIRAHSVRAGATTPWIVDDNLVKKYSVPRKFTDFLLSPVKMSEGFKKSEEENLKKRKASTGNGPSAKKAKIDKIRDKSTDNKKQTKLTKSPMKNSPLKTLDKKSSSKSSLKKSTSSSDRDSPKKKSKSSDEKTKLKKQKSTDSSSSEDIPLSSLPSKSGKSTPKKNTPSKKVISLDSDSDDDRPLSDVRPLSKVKSLKSPKKGMKQMTLFDMKKKLKTPEKRKTPLKDQKSPSKGMKTPEKKTKPEEKIKTPIIVAKLVKAIKSEEQKKINALVLQAAKILTSPQRKRLPESVKDMVLSKHKKMEEQKKIDNMTPEQKAEYFRQKKLESKKRMREKQSELRKRFEDLDLEQQPLPQPKLVSTPDGLPNELFGDVAMVTEFISCYAGLLMPDDEYPIFTDALMKALSSEKEGFTYLSRVLVVLLQTLLQDQISEDYQEIKVPLSDIPVNAYTSSELVRLCLRKQDVDDVQSDISDSEEQEEEEVPDDVLQLLETKEFYQLEAEQKLQILKGLCLRIMGTYSVQDYMEEKQQTASKLWKRKLAELKQKNDQLKKEKEQKKEEIKTSKPDETTKEEIEKNAMISMFYGKSEKGNNSRPSTPEIESAESTADENTDDLASVVKRRRLMTVKAAAEKEKIEQERRKLKEKEYEVYRKQMEKEKFEKEFDEGIRLAKLVLRLSPVGTDRNHNRYWVFSATTPGLYIEKGWVTDDIDYSFPSLSRQSSDSDSSDDDDSDENGKGAIQDNSGEKEIETSVPHTGQNLWFTYDSVKDLDKVIECLHTQGYRESQLKAQLKKFYPIITKAINVAKRNNLELRDSNGDEEMLNCLKKELLETETRLRHGGLGGVEEFDVWSAKLESAQDVKSLGQCLIETEKFVVDKFREGIMKPKKKKVMEVKEEDKEDEDEEEEEEKEELISKGVVNWREAVENACTYSRLYVLLGILDACVKWEKSAENAKCKICRRKDDDATLLLCDECNQAFHMNCLRPALTSIPKGDWLCPACAPQRSRNRENPKVSYSGRSYKVQEDVSDSDDNEGIEHEEKCVECGGDEELIYCAECPAAYHLECHDPPLRRPPRGQWSCNECKTGVKRSTRSRARKKTAIKQKKAPPRRKQYKEESVDESSEEEDSSDEESEEESEESESEAEETKEPPAKAPRRSRKQTSARQSRREKSPQTSRRSKESTKKPIEIEEEKPKSRRAPSDLSLCLDIINSVMKHPSSWPFLEAVNKRDVPDYCKIVKHPMDFQKIKDKLRCMVYGSVNEVIKDVHLIFTNSEAYNKAGSEVIQCTQEVERYFSNLMKKDLPLYQYQREKLTNGFDSHEQLSKSRSRR